MLRNHPQQLQAHSLSLRNSCKAEVFNLSTLLGRQNTGGKVGDTMQKYHILFIDMRCLFFSMYDNCVLFFINYYVNQEYYNYKLFSTVYQQNNLADRCQSVDGDEKRCFRRHKFQQECLCAAKSRQLGSFRINDSIKIIITTTTISSVYSNVAYAEPNVVYDVELRDH